ncbi:MAG: methyltransferase, partial [Bacteroidaceae bacterium]|nr:methyltransferase [Bacteroidaceae bacterium]
MANNHFQFKQFTIRQDRCAMKVGTDGTLLGAWAPVQDAGMVLDIGTGTGLMALMIAQRQPSAWVEAIDLDESAVSQAVQNVADSPFASRIRVFQQDVLEYNEFGKFDLLVCNPPYFQDSLPSPDPSRTLARHNDSMPLDALCSKAYDLLTDNGLFCLVLPYSQLNMLIREATGARFFLQQMTEVCTKVGKPVKRVLLALGKSAQVSLQKDVLY